MMSKFGAENKPTQTQKYSKYDQAEIEAVK